MKQCYFCAGGRGHRAKQYTLAPDPDHPAFVVCDRKKCTAARAKQAPAARLAKYVARQQFEKAEAEAAATRNHQWAKEFTIRRLADELLQARIQKFGEDPVIYAEQLAAGWVCPCKDHQVSAAAQAALHDAATMAAMTDADLENRQRQHAKEEADREAAFELERCRDRLSGVTDNQAVVFGVHFGKLSPAHVEVRRNIAAAHAVTWTEADIATHGGIQSWFTGYEHQVDWILGDVAKADTLPIPARRCDVCGKPAELGSRRVRVANSPYIDYFCCARAGCAAKYEMKHSDPDQRWLLWENYGRNIRLSQRKPHPAPGPAPISAGGTTPTEET